MINHGNSPVLYSQISYSFLVYWAGNNHRYVLYHMPASSLKADYRWYRAWSPMSDILYGLLRMQRTVGG